ncbi:MAG: glycosyltransferase [Chromatiales bacterium]|nr:glycosyltransferase [Chromatiales bacterium]
MAIPRLIHQTWRHPDIPLAWQGFVASWRRHHPQWTWRLWTDADNRAFVAAHDPWFLGIYDAYPEPIMRADAVRYFLMARLGGLYVDMDFECLRPLDPLLAERRAVVGLEPAAHAARLQARARGLDHVVGNALLASEPGHPLWEHVIRELVASHREPGVLDATGPFMLTRALARFAGRDAVTVLPASAVYPLAADDAAATRVDDDAYAVHHWSGSWVTRAGVAPADDASRVALRVVERLHPVSEGTLDVAAARALWGDTPPLVSCLMVTARRVELALRAVECFRRQTYPTRELVVVDDDPDPTLGTALARLRDPSIRHLRLAPGEASLGALRNHAVQQARGALIAQWDDDDLSDPARLEIQVSALLAARADACLLSRERLWWPARHCIAISGPRAWEGSMLARRDALAPYPDRDRGEDTPVVARLARHHRLAVLDAPWLYTYVFHGRNTFDTAHFEALVESAEWVADGPSHAQTLIAMADRLPIDLAAHLDAAARADAAATRPAAAAPAGLVTAPLLPPGDLSQRHPKVLILTPVKDASAFVERFVANVLALDHDPRRLSVGVLGSDCADDTRTRLDAALPRLRRALSRVTLAWRDFGLRLPGPRHEAGTQRARRAVLARARNALLASALSDEDWVLWLDVDVTELPPDLIARLLAAGRDVVAPSCVTHPGGPSYDLNTFVVDPAGPALDPERHLIDGLWQPPRGYGRIYLDALRDHDLVRVDAVGGTALLVRADLHREGLVFPAYPVDGHIETEGLARVASALGIDCWGMPRVEIVHPPHD